MTLADERCIVDGVIYSLRANGFLVHIPAYGLKGPVYLENKVKCFFFMLCGKKLMRFFFLIVN